MKCSAITLAGTRCKRSATVGGLCTQHSKKSSSAGRAVLLSYGPYLNYLVKQLHPHCEELPVKTIAVIDKLLNYVFNRICTQILVTKAKSNKLDKAIRILFTEELAKHAIIESSKAVRKFANTKDSGVTFPVDAIKQHMIALGVHENALYMTAVIEYLAAEIIERSGVEAIKEGVPRITVENVYAGIKEDEELSELFKSEMA